MAKYETILEAIGNTPLVRLNNITKGLKCKVYAKLEFLNPGGSVKDRIALKMIEGAEKDGRIKKGATIIEATSGNTGAGVALICVYKGYKAIFTINDKQSREKIDILKAFGAEVIVCPTAVRPEDPRQYTQVAKKLEKEITNSIYLNQYDNPKNPEAHYQTTGPEIWRDTEGKITHFVCGMGTCGTITGVGKYLKEKNPNIKVIGVDPEGSILLDYFYQRKITDSKVYKVEGIGEDFIPGVLNLDYIDEVVRVSDKESFQWTRKLLSKEGIFAGGSSGSAVCAAMKIAQRLTVDDTMVVILPDGGYKYLSKIYNNEWMRENQFLETEILRYASDIISLKTQPLFFANPKDNLGGVFKIMHENDFSQMPVVENSSIVGTIYEDDIIELVFQGKSINSMIVREILKPPLPILPLNVSLNEIYHYIPSQCSAVLIKIEDDKYQIITKYDIINLIGKLEIGE